MRTPRWTPLALLVAFGMAAGGCVAADGASYRSASYGHPPTPAPSYSHGGYSGSPEFSRIIYDADQYAGFLDRELRLNSRQERDIERLLIDRTRDLLRRTHLRDHHRVYPFPRYNRTGATRHWWGGADRSIERMLSPHQRQMYQYLVRSF